MSRTIEGWNSIPDGFGAVFDLGRAPVWLRLAYRTPFVDRFIYPRLVSAGLGYLVAHPDTPASPAAVAQAEARGWKVVEAQQITAIFQESRSERPLRRK